MKKMMKFESYIDDKITSLKKVKKIVDFIEKYKFEYFVIAMENEEDEYMFEDIRKENGVYVLEYINYNKSDKIKITDLLLLPTEVIDSLYRTCNENHRFDVGFHLEMGIGSIDMFINILKIHKGKIVFSKWIFDMLIESDLQKDANGFKFQNILFSKQPDSYKMFIDSSFGSLDGDYDPILVNPKILKKYDGLLGEYYQQKLMEREAKKFNL
jgi:hypothetical protein